MANLWLGLPIGVSDAFDVRAREVQGSPWIGSEQEKLGGICGAHAARHN